MAKAKVKSYGKEFERQVYSDFSKVPGISIDRIPDQVTKYKGSSQNICDFIAYKKPTLLYLECKSTHGASLSIYSEPKPDKKGELHGFYGNIRDNQWEGLLEKSKIPGVRAGVIIWFVDKDVTLYVPIEILNFMREQGYKSINFKIEPFILATEHGHRPMIAIPGKKKRTMFEYDFTNFFDTQDIQ